MKKSFKFLLGAILVGAVVALASCELGSIIAQATYLSGKTYAATINGTQVRLRFTDTQQNGANYRLEVYSGSESIDHDIIEWNIDTEATGDVEAKDIFIYCYGDELEVEDKIGTLEPDEIAADVLTVKDGSFYIWGVYIPNGTVFTKQ